MLANLQKFFCCSNTLPPSYQIEESSGFDNSNKYLVLPLSRMNSKTKNEIGAEKELIYYSNQDAEVYSINLSDVIKKPSLSIKKVVFGTNHCLILLIETEHPEKTYLAGFGANNKGQLGLDVFSKKSSDEDINAKNYYDRVHLINAFDINTIIVDIAASNDFSLVLVVDSLTKKKKLYRFELSQSDLFNLGNFTVNRISSVKEEKCGQDIIENITHIYAKNGRILLQDDTENTLYIKGMMFSMDICDKYKLFKKFQDKKIAQVSLGLNHCLILFTNNSLVSLGHNEYGELGLKCYNPKLVNELRFFEGHTIKKISSGLRHNLVLCEDGTLYAFGDNHSKQCAGESSFYSEPRIVNIKDVVDIECGGKFSLCKNRKGEVFTWGLCDFFFRDEIYNSSSNNGDYFRLLNDIKLKNINGMFAGDYVVLFYAEKFG